MTFLKSLLLIILFVFPLKAQTQSVDDALSVLGGGVLDKIDDSINLLFDRVDSTVVGMRANAEGLLASAKSDMSDFLDKSLNDLEDQERAIWLYYRNALTEVDNRVLSYSREARMTVFDVASAAQSVIPFSSNEPRIYWVEVTPPMFVHDAVERRVTAYGINLDRADNTLAANGIEARRVTPSPTQLGFAINSVEVEDGLRLVFNLSAKRKGFAFLGAWTDRAISPKVFELSRQADLIGQARLIYQENTYPVISRRWPADGEYHKVNCQRGGFSGTDGCNAKFGPEFIPAKDGYSVMVDSVEVDHFTQGCRDTRTKVRSLEHSSNGFKVYGTAYPNSGAGRRCYLNARFTWRERSSVAVEVEKQTEEQQLRRSMNGITFRYPSQGARPIGISVLHVEDDKATVYDLASIRADFQVNAQPGTGIVEIVWD